MTTIPDALSPNGPGLDLPLIQKQARALSAAERSPTPQPAALRWVPPNVNFLSSTSGYSYAGEITGPVVVWGIVRYFVDLTNATGLADDAKAGTSQGAPLLTYSAARAKTNAGGVAGTEIVIFGHKQDVIVKELASWTAVTVNYRTVNRELPNRVSLLRVASANAPTWSATAGQPGVYECTISAADAASLIDMSNKVDMAARVQIPVGGTAADQARHQRTVLGTPPAWHVPPVVASIAAVGATPGSRYHDGAKLYVQAIDSRNLIGDQKMLPLAGGVFGRSAAGFSDRVQWWRGIDWIGGTVPFFANTGSDTNFGCHFIFESCSMQASGPGGSGGLQVTGVCRITFSKSAAWFNYADGTNYHAFVALSDAGPFVVEVDSAFGGNGTTGSTAGSDNDSTAHERTDVVSQNCVYLGSSDRVIADINNARRWLIGGYVGTPVDGTGISLAGVATADNAQIFIEGTQFAPPGPNAAAVRADGASSIGMRSVSPALTAVSASAAFVGPY